MAYDSSYGTDDRAIPLAVRRFLRHRLFELAGLALFVVLIATGIALASWSVDDPSLNHSLDKAARNWLGYPGAVAADELMQFFGLAVLVLLAIPIVWATRLVSHVAIARPLRSLPAWLGGVLLASGAMSALPTPARWALPSGLGGNCGDVLHGMVMVILSPALRGYAANLVGLAILVSGALWVGFYALYAKPAVALPSMPKRKAAAAAPQPKQKPAASPALWNRLRLRLSAWRKQRAADAAQSMSAPLPAVARPDIIARLAPNRPAATAKGAARIEPVLAPRRPAVIFADEEDDGNPREQAASEDRYGDELGAPFESAENAEGYDEAERDVEVLDDAEEPEEIGAKPVAVERASAAGKPRKEPKPRKSQRLANFELPPLELLAEPKRVNRSSDLSDEMLEHNARMLEGVLEDFGVKGQIIKVRPGPVVTLYELEPAPGIKSSRVISLADDIARSMSAVSARVAVVPGRNAIGIELPNSKRETVYLRELLSSEAFENTGQNLAMALGKNIGGEPILADLCRMPHLLIAGTTGSGKSVGINTMILSLLYRLPPDRCKLIMIDPKMLELSVYEGIPHLLSPVVTDPRKAVVALKWAVREMEERYRKMSKLSVRNIDGYNARVKQAMAKGEQPSRTVQTGFDPDSGEPIFEEERIDLQPMPYIVVIIDEMADLMMVAGKDIEGAVQRLAQMARAAGIHVIMATQRPSVDVITGTIKANFPTRVSFQVTSKIDSRTILGEQGAEQLLGQGDMLYMAGGGRISRLHGPFVTDEEVEKIVRHLKSQGAPEYVESVTEEADEEFGDAPALPGELGGGSGDELYDQAVAVVLRDKKVSTSYIQRRLQVGYNKAASLIERMEKEGLISSANATGKREILVPGDSARD